MGRPFMPWQHHVANLAGEIDPATGNLWYREVVVSVPRQSGKTTLLLPKWVWRAEAAAQLGGRQRMLYAAQTKNDAVDKFDEDFIEDLAASRIMRGRYRVSNNQGRKRVRFQSGSILSPVATLSATGHGKTLDDGTLDEAWAQTDNRVEAGWRPAMITRPSPQLWVVSTKGGRDSSYFNNKIRRARAIVEAGDPTSRLAFVEFSADPAADPQDPATWATCMPALGFTQTPEAVRHEMQTLEGGMDEFGRAYLNISQDDADGMVFPAESWANCLDPASQRSGAAVLAIDVDPQRKYAGVSMAATRADGLPMVKVVRHGAGVSWVVEHVGAMVRDKGVERVVIDSVGPVKNLAREIEAEIADAGAELAVMTTSDVCDAFGDLFDAVVTEQVRHLGQPELEAALAAATTRMVGLRKAWDRREPDDDITPMVSATHALWGLATQSEQQFFASRR